MLNIGMAEGFFLPLIGLQCDYSIGPERFKDKFALKPRFATPIYSLWIFRQVHGFTARGRDVPSEERPLKNELWKFPCDRCACPFLSFDSFCFQLDPPQPQTFQWIFSPGRERGKGWNQEGSEGILQTRWV